jgi:WD40 repeat protein
VRKLTDGTLVWKVEGHSAPISAIAISPYGNHLACALDDGSLHLWHIGERKRLWQTEAGKPVGSTVAFSPDGKRIGIGARGGSVCIRTLQDGEIIGTYQLWTSDGGASVSAAWENLIRVRMLAFSTDRMFAAASDGESIVAWDLRTGLIVFSFNKRALSEEIMVYSYDSLWFSADDSVLIVEEWTEHSRSIIAWSIATGEQLPDREAVALHSAITYGARRHWEWEGLRQSLGGRVQLSLIDRKSGAAVAHYPEVLDRVTEHPNGRVWGNRRATQMTLLQLEGA